MFKRRSSDLFLFFIILGFAQNTLARQKASLLAFALAYSYFCDCNIVIMTREQKIFKLFYLKHFKAVAAFCRAYVKDEKMAMDMAQEAFYRLLQHWEPEYSTDSARAFIYITAKNLCLDHLRHRKFSGEMPGSVDEQLVTEENLLAEIIRQEAIEGVRQAVASLSGRSRQVIRLTLEGKTNPEIAEALGISVNTVKFAKKEAYVKLRRYLGNEYLVLLALEVAQMTNFL